MAVNILTSPSTPITVDDLINGKWNNRYRHSYGQQKTIGISIDGWNRVTEYTKRSGNITR